MDTDEAVSDVFKEEGWGGSWVAQTLLETFDCDSRIDTEQSQSELSQVLDSPHREDISQYQNGLELSTFGYSNHESIFVFAYFHYKAS